MPQDTSQLSRQQQSVNIAGVRLETKRFEGDEDKPTLIFLHEGLGCVDMWRDFPERLSELTGCPALVYSRQGYGHSNPCSVPRPLTYMHVEALEVLPELQKTAGIGEHVLIGHSDGGSISLINAGGKPSDGLRGVVTMSPHVFCEEITVRSIEAARKAYLEADLRKGLKKYHGENTDCAFWGWNKAWLNPDFINWNIEEYLPSIKVPQLVIQGNEDPYGSAAQVDAIESQSGGPARVCMIQNCGHSPHKEKPLECLEEINLFLNSLQVVD